MNPFSPSSRGLDAAQAGAVLYATSIAIVMLNVAPAVESHLRQEARMSIAQVGAVYFIELAAMGLASAPAQWWLGRVDKARVARLAFAAFLCGNLLSSIELVSFVPYAAARALTGVAAGTLMILGMTVAARAREPHRMFALITFVQLASGAALLALMPVLAGDGRGLRGLFQLSALFGLAGLVCAGGFSMAARSTVGVSAEASPADAAERRAMMAATALALAFNIVAGGLWAFAAEYAASLDISRLHTEQVLTAATAVGLAGAALAFALDDRRAPRVILLLGLLGLLLGAGLMHASIDAAGFAAGCHVFSFSWNFCLPRLLSLAAARDRSGRTMATMNLGVAFGLAIGPLAAAAVIETLGLGALFPFAAAGLTVAALLMLPLSQVQ